MSDLDERQLLNDSQFLDEQLEAEMSQFQETFGNVRLQLFTVITPHHTTTIPQFVAYSVPGIDQC